MRSHRQIVQAYGAAAMARSLKARGFRIGASTPQRWADRNSIPSDYWMSLVELNAATLEELAQAAAPERTGTGVADSGRAFEGRRPEIYPPLARNEQERREALNALLGMAGEGYSSNGWKFNRDEIYDRDEP
jgi:hypothetical protein